jgi:hypothetical protein
MVRAVAVLIGAALVGCGGGVPLMHPAHPMEEGEFTLGGGFSGTLGVAGSVISPDANADLILEEGAVAPGIAPWVGARLGIDGSIDAGLTYTGRGARLDGRYAWDLGDEAFSVGLAISGLLPKRQDLADGSSFRVGGFGGDLPILFGVRSTADIYCLWLGARAGAELLRGSHDFNPDTLADTDPGGEDISGWHAHTGGVIGFRVGFRYVFAAIELDGAMHWASADVGETSVSIRQFALSPAGALVVRF